MENQQAFSYMLLILQIILALATLHKLNQSQENKEQKKQSNDKQDAQNKEKDQHVSSQFIGNQTGSGPSFSNFDIDVPTTQRQRTDSFSVPNPSQNKSRKNSENIPQTPMFQPDKSKKIQLNLQTNTYGNNSKKISPAHHQEFNLNQSNNSMMVVNYDLDQQSDDMRQGDIQQQHPQLKSGMSIKDIMKVETPEKKKLLQQNKMLFQENAISNNNNNNNNNNNHFNNPKNFIQSPDSNFYYRQARQNSVQEDKRSKQHYINQSQTLKEKEAKLNNNDNKIRDAHWIQPTSKSSKKYQEKREQNLNQQYRDIPNPNFDRFEQNDSKALQSRKRHVMDSFTHAYDTDEMEDEQSEKNYSINKILEVQKKRKEEYLQKFMKQKEAEKKNQILFNAPYSNNMNTIVTINHREQDKIEIEETIKEKPQFIQAPQVIQQTKKEEVVIPQQPVENKGKLFVGENAGGLFAQNQNKPANISINIPEKSIQLNQDEKSTPLEKNDDSFKTIINPPPAPKAQVAPFQGLFANSTQPSQAVEKKEQNLFNATQPQKQTPLFNLPEANTESNKKPEGFKEQFQENSQEKNLITTPKQTISSVNQIVSNPFDSQNSLLSKSQTPQQQTQTPQQVQIQNDIQNEIAQKKLPRKQASAGLFGNLTSGQTDQKQEELNASTQPNTSFQLSSTPQANTGLFSNMSQQQSTQQQPANNGVQNINPSLGQTSAEQQKVQSPKIQEIPIPDKKIGLFGNLDNNNNNKINNDVKDVFQAGEIKQTTGLETASSNQIKAPFSLDQQGGLFAKITKNVDEQKNDIVKPPAPAAGTGTGTGTGTGLFNNLGNNNTTSNEQKSFLNNNLAGGLFAQNNNANNTNTNGNLLGGLQPNAAVGGLFGKKEENGTQQNAEQKVEKPSEGLFGNLKKDNQEGGEKAPAIGLSFLKQDNKQNGLGFLSKPGEEKPKETQSIFGQTIQIQNLNGGLFDQSSNNHLKDKQQQQQQQQQQNNDFRPLPPKAINQENEQLFVKVDDLNSQDKQQKQQVVGQGLFGNLASSNQPPAQNGLFSQQQKELPKQSVSLFPSSNNSQQGGLFGNQNQSLSQQTTNPQAEPPKNGLFGNNQNINKGGLFGQSNNTSNTGLFANLGNGNQQNSLFSNSVGTGLFSKPAESTTQ